MKMSVNTGHLWIVKAMVSSGQFQIAMDRLEYGHNTWATAVDTRSCMGYEQIVHFEGRKSRTIEGFNTV